MISIVQAKVFKFLALFKLCERVSSSEDACIASSEFSFIFFLQWDFQQ